MDFNSWAGFNKGAWCEDIDVSNFIKTNYTSYLGDFEFLVGPTKRTQKLLEKFSNLQIQEQLYNGVLDIDTSTVSSLTSFAAGYLDKETELIVGLQTNRPLKRGVNPFGGIKMARSACEAYGYSLSEKIEQEFLYRTTHNDGVFRVYTDEMKLARKSGIITGLPDAYGRGRIIGDYRRTALYGVDTLIKFKKRDKDLLAKMSMDVDNIRLSEELYQQIAFLEKLKEMAMMYKCDISLPAKNAHEAIQWTYFAYLAAIKEQNGAAMSLGRVSTFFDIYIERDLLSGALDEEKAQELVDDFVLKLRMGRHLRTPEYNELFGGDPMWITESIGGMTCDGACLVTKTSYRFLHTLNNLGPSPEPNLTILWSTKLPQNFKNFCSKLSIETNSLQYENDDIMRTDYDDDYAIACCVSAMKVGKQMQFFGARCNLPKLLLLALNNGRDEISSAQIAPTLPDSLDFDDNVLKYDEVIEKFKFYCDWLANLYVNTMNVIHYMHDKYAYEKIQMALHDTFVTRFMAFGVAGLSVIADSLSAIKHAKVRPIKDETGLITDFICEGDFPKFGNNDDRVDNIAVFLLENMMSSIKKTPTYRNSIPTLSVLTITSNVVYGKKTGATPDGRKMGDAFAPGANPMHNREEKGALAALNSVSKLPYNTCKDGISNTFSITPDALGKTLDIQIQNLSTLLDGYFSRNAHHININVLNKNLLLDAIDHPENYPNLTIRVSGYAVNFHKLTKEQQNEVIQRTFFEGF